jgi:outer membrane protein TolC
MRSRARYFVALGILTIASGDRIDASAEGRWLVQTVQVAVPVAARPRRYDGPPLTLADAVEEAMGRNPELLAVARQQDVARARPAQERFLPPPMVETQMWQWPINTLNPANTNMFMFMATQDLPGRGKRDLRVALAQQDVELAKADLTLRTGDIVRQVREAYAMLGVTRQAIDTYVGTGDVLREFADIAQVKYATGRISQQDVLKAIVELSKLHDVLIILEQQEQVAAARLNTLMNRPIDAPIGPLADSANQTLVASAQQLESAALAGQPELQIARQQIARAQAELAVARQDYKPDFSIQAGYMLLPRETDGVVARVGVTWPGAPWSRGKLDARVQEMNAGVEAATSRERALENATRLAVREAYLMVKSAERRAALLRTTIIPQTEQALDVSRAAYQSDRLEFLALLENERALLDARLEYYRALAEFEQAVAGLERVVGTSLGAGALTPSHGATGVTR